MTIDDKEKLIESLRTDKVQFRQQVRDAEEKNTKYEMWYLPKLRETKKYQKEIYSELERLKNDAELLPWMFRAEAVQRKKYKLEKTEAIDKMSKYQKEHFKLVNERDDLKNELERKQRLAIQAIAARGNIKTHLDEEKNKNIEAQKNIEALNQSLVDAANEVKKFKQKHDEMFASVSGLNARIEELE